MRIAVLRTADVAVLVSIPVFELIVATLLALHVYYFVLLGTADSVCDFDFLWISSEFVAAMAELWKCMVGWLDLMMWALLVVIQLAVVLVLVTVMECVNAPPPFDCFLVLHVSSVAVHYVPFRIRHAPPKSDMCVLRTYYSTRLHRIPVGCLCL